MQQLFRFIFRNRSLLTFLLLLSLGFFLVVQFNRYPAAVYLHTSNGLSGQLLSSRQEIKDYFSLGSANRQLAEENARLRQQLINPIASQVVSTPLQFHPTENLPHQYQYYPAKVINNSWQRYRNYLTVNKGSDDGLKPGMGVVGPTGVVGQVAFVSKHFATIISLLHGDLQVSSMLTSTGNYCTVNWPGPDPEIAKVLYLPLHTQPQVGDTVVTSGYNSVFPQGLSIGKIQEFGQTDDANFYEVDLALTTDFQALDYVYIIENVYLPEQDSIQQITNSVL